MPDRRSHRGPHESDRQLFAAEHLPALHAASSDRVILDRCSTWFNLTREVVARRAPEAWIVDLSPPSLPSDSR